MSYVRQTWEDFVTLVDAEKMTHIEDGIVQNEGDIEKNASDIAELSNSLADLDILSQNGTSIPSGSDLNDYMTPGKYYVQNASTAASLENTPITNAGFCVIILKAQSKDTRLFQFIFDSYNFRIYVRSYCDSSSNSRWYDWASLIS